MKKLLFALFVLFCFFRCSIDVSAQTYLPWYQEPSLVNPSTSDILMIYHNGASYTISLSNLLAVLQFNYSLSENSLTATLLNDVLAPGNYYYYGTASGGAKGWYAIANPTALTFIESLTLSGGNVSLLNDSLSPGASYYYGTNPSGTKGYYPFPAGYTFQKARAYSNNSQTIPNNLITKVQINTVSFDPASIVNTSTYRILPTLAGYYQVNGEISFQNIANVMAILYKNGSNNSTGNHVSSNVYIGIVSDIIYCNGTTDYIELWAYQASGGGNTLDNTSDQNYLSLVGPF